MVVTGRRSRKEEAFGPSATLVCGLQRLRSVCGLKLLVYEALSYEGRRSRKEEAVLAFPVQMQLMQ